HFAAWIGALDLLDGLPIPIHRVGRRDLGRQVALYDQPRKFAKQAQHLERTLSFGPVGEPKTFDTCSLDHQLSRVQRGRVARERAIAHQAASPAEAGYHRDRGGSTNRINRMKSALTTSNLHHALGNRFGWMHDHEVSAQPV